MDYAIQLLLPIIGGLLLGSWLTRTFGLSPIWTLVLAILGMAAGIGVLYKRYSYPQLYKTPPFRTKKTDQPPEQPGVHHKELDFLYKINEEPPKKLDEPDEGDKDEDDDERLF